MERDDFLTSLDELMNELNGVKSAREQVLETTEASTSVIKKLGEVQNSWSQLKQKWDNDWEDQLIQLSKSFETSTRKLTGEQDELGKQILEIHDRAKAISVILETFSTIIKAANRQLQESVNKHTESLSDNIDTIKELVVKFENTNTTNYKNLHSRLEQQDESFQNLKRNLHSQLKDFGAPISDLTSQMDATVEKIGKVVGSLEKSAIERYQKLTEKMESQMISINSGNKELEAKLQSQTNEMKERNQHVERLLLSSQKKSGRMQVLSVILLFANLILLGAILYLTR